MNLYDAGAVELLKAALDKAQAEKATRDARLEVLEPLVIEYQLLETARSNERAGKTSIGGLRTQLALALLYRETGNPPNGESAPMTLP